MNATVLVASVSGPIYSQVVSTNDSRMTRPKRKGFSLRSQSQDKQCILDDRDDTTLESEMDDDLLQAPGSTASGTSRNFSSDSGYFSPKSSLSVELYTSTRTRSSTWVASLRSLLQKQKPRRRPTLIFSEGIHGSLTAPRNEEELDQLLSEIWEKDTAGSPKKATSQYVRKVTELKEFFDRKMIEIAQRQATYVSELLYQDETTPLLTADELTTDNVSMKRVLLEAQISYKFDELRFTLKQEVVQTIFSLRAHYIDTGRRRRTLRPKATKILKQWFERHLDHPYPTEAEKSLLGVQCELSMEQVSTWFSNRRCRSKAFKTVRGRRSKLS